MNRLSRCVRTRLMTTMMTTGNPVAMSSAQKRLSRVTSPAPARRHALAGRSKAIHTSLKFLQSGAAAIASPHEAGNIRSRATSAGMIAINRFACRCRDEFFAMLREPDLLTYTYCLRVVAPNETGQRKSAQFGHANQRRATQHGTVGRNLTAPSGAT